MTEDVAVAKRKLRDAKAELRYVKHLQESRAAEQREKDVYTSGTWRRDKVVAWAIGNGFVAVTLTVLYLILDAPIEFLWTSIAITLPVFNLAWASFGIGVNSGRKYERYNRQGLS